MRKPRTDEELDTSVETVDSMVIDFRQFLADTFRGPVDDIAAPKPPSSKVGHLCSIRKRASLTTIFCVLVEVQNLSIVAKSNRS